MYPVTTRTTVRHTCCSGGADLVTSCLEEASIALELLLLEIMVAEVVATDLCG